MYDPISFWKGQGSTEPEPILKDPQRVPQEQKIVEVLKKCGDFKSFLDLGCGFGRICHLVLENFPNVEVVHGVDVSAERVVRAVNNCKEFLGTGVGPDIRFFNSEFLKFKPDRKYDVVFSCEVLMHAMPLDFGFYIEKMIDLSKKHVINVDWYETQKPDYPIAEWNFMHDYPHVYDMLVLDGQLRQMRSYNIGQKQFLFHAVK